jgi:hypothetical protein
MKVRIDFSLNRRFGVVEQTIFRLILNGLTSAQQIRKLLWIFSDEVIANAIRRLVNEQLVCAIVESRTLSLSDAVLAVIETCLKNSYDIIIPDTLANTMSDEILLITDNKMEEAIIVKKAIIAQLLPGIKLGFLANSLDFSVCGRSENNE